MQYTYMSLFFRSIIVIGDRCWLPEILPSISHKFCLAEYLLGASIRWTFQNSYKDLGGFVKHRLPRGKSSEFFVSPQKRWFVKKQKKWVSCFLRHDFGRVHYFNSTDLCHHPRSKMIEEARMQDIGGQKKSPCFYGRHQKVT